jgi:uncharacterized protein (TIGR03067 family)
MPSSTDPVIAGKTLDMQTQRLLILGLNCILAGEPPKDDLLQSEAKRLEGNWKLIGAEISGHKLTAEELKVADLDHVVFTKDTASLRKAGEKDSKVKYRLDPNQHPKAIDMIPEDGPHKGKTTRWLYILEGDSLKLCYDAEQLTKRPTEFTTTEDSDRVILVLQRVKR